MLKKTKLGEKSDERLEHFPLPVGQSTLWKPNPCSSIDTVY